MRQDDLQVYIWQPGVEEIVELTNRELPHQRRVFSDILFLIDVPVIKTNIRQHHHWPRAIGQK